MQFLLKFPRRSLTLKSPSRVTRIVVLSIQTMHIQRLECCNAEINISILDDYPIPRDSALKKIVRDLIEHFQLLLCGNFIAFVSISFSYLDKKKIYPSLSSVFFTSVRAINNVRYSTFFMKILIRISLEAS